MYKLAWLIYRPYKLAWLVYMPWLMCKLAGESQSLGPRAGSPRSTRVALCLEFLISAPSLLSQSCVCERGCASMAGPAPRPTISLKPFLCVGGRGPDSIAYMRSS